MNIRLSSEEQEELVLKNQNLVHFFVRKLGVLPNDYEDMFSIGMIGLIKAAATYDKFKNISFATYASRCINNEFYMYFRKQKSHKNDVSLQEPISNDGEGHEMTLGDKIPNSDRDFTEKVAENEIFTQIISIILNLLESSERLIMLYEIADINQNVIAENLNISQSYVSKLEKKLNKKVKAYFNTKQQFKEGFSMTVVDDLYKISFSSKDIKQFNKIFARFLQHITSVTDLPDFKINCNKERIIVQIPAHPESFSFIAQIIQEIDDFNITFVSNKDILSKNNHELKEIQSDDINEAVGKSDICTNIESTIETDFVKNIKKTDNNSIGGKINQVKQVRDYMLSKTSFTVKELKHHFPNITTTTINNAIQLAKNKELITSVSRGKYVVNKI